MCLRQLAIKYLETIHQPGNTWVINDTRMSQDSDPQNWPREWRLFIRIWTQMILGPSTGQYCPQALLLGGDRWQMVSWFHCQVDPGTKLWCQQPQPMLLFFWWGRGRLDMFLVRQGNTHELKIYPVSTLIRCEKSLSSRAAFLCIFCNVSYSSHLWSVPDILR